MYKLERYLAIFLLLFAVGFNLWLYRFEPTSKVDPNDNAFQFGLIDRTNTIWNYSQTLCSGKTDPKSPKFFLSGIPGICTLSLLSDHWVHNWAQGYNLPFYYPHVPQITIVSSWRFFTGIIGQSSCHSNSLFPPPSCSISLFSYYHIIIYMLMSLLPIAVFFGIRAMGFPLIAAGIGALLSSHISTDGLYGLDQSSYLWRGWGLSSQLFAAIWMPLSLGYSLRFLLDRTPLTNNGNIPKLFSWVPIAWRRFLPNMRGPYPWAVLFTTAQVAGHLGLGLLMFIAIGIAGITPALKRFLDREPIRDVWEDLLHGIARVAFIAVPSIGLLSYWILPSMLLASYHNISFWDPVWKFDSYGVAEVLVNLANGLLFDFDRYPVFTVLTLLGVFVPFFVSKKSSFSLIHNKDSSKVDNKQWSNGTMEQHTRPTPQTTNYQLLSTSLSILFIFWLLLYFGRTTWGGLIDLIPGMVEFHISRLIVMLHLLSMFLVPIALIWLAEKLPIWLQTLGEKFKKTIPAIPPLAVALILTAFAALLSYPSTIKYASWNDVLIKQANGNWNKAKASVQDLFATLYALPQGRIFAGRGGGYGKDFRVAETPYYMFISTFGYPTIAWLPETWSMNSDTEQYFSENNLEHYALFNLSYVLAPPSEKPQPFWRLIKETPSWNLYAVDTRTKFSIVPPEVLSLSKDEGGQSIVPPEASRKGGLSTNYIGVGTSPTVIRTDKNHLVNLVHLWVQSDYHIKGIYPELTYKPIELGDPRPQFSMVDEAMYKLRDGSIHSLMGQPPVYKSDPPPMTVSQTETIGEMEYRATVTLSKECSNCIALLRQTAHPNWKAWIDGKPAKPFTVMPFYSAVNITQSGTHTIVFRYEPSGIKVFLMVLGILASGILLFLWVKQRKSS